MMSMLMQATSVATLVQLSEREGITFHKVVADLPHDPASLFVIALMFVCTALILWTGRSRDGKGGRPA